MASTPYISEIQIFAFDFAPRGWAFCNGQLLAINTNQALFSLLGTTYGGNGVNTFALPDLRGRVPLGWGNGAGLTLNNLGAMGGAENVTLLPTQIPPHTHSITTTAAQSCQSVGGNQNTPAASFPATHETENIYSTTSNANMGAPTVNTTIGIAGGSQPHSNLPPYLTMNFCIAIQGIFPSRN